MVNEKKEDISDLAIMGGNKSFINPIFVGTPNIQNTDRFFEMVHDIFRRKWLTNNGEYVKRFESDIQNYLGVKHAIVVSNGTVGLEIAIRALKLSGEVIVPSYTFIATPHSLLWSGVKPVFCDIDPKTYNIDVNKAKNLINANTSGIMAVDVYGRSSEKEKLESLAKDHNLSLIFDAAHAFGNSFHGEMIGNFGDAEVFSFHATKFLNTFEGGAITTNNDELARRIREIRNFGFGESSYSQFIGTNGKMTEISAAMGIVNLENIEQIIQANRINYEAYRKKLKNMPGVNIIEYPHTEKVNCQYVIIEVDATVSGLNRDELSVILGAEGVGTRKYFWPACHQMEPYKTLFPTAGLRLPITESTAEKVLALPTGTAISLNDVDSLCNIISLAIKEPRTIKNQLSKYLAKGNVS